MRYNGNGNSQLANFLGGEFNVDDLTAPRLRSSVCFRACAERGPGLDSVIDPCADATSAGTEFVEIAGDGGNRFGTIGFELSSAEQVDRRLTQPSGMNSKLTFAEK
jgi:hypothetical protein